MKVTICFLFALALFGVISALPALPAQLSQGDDLEVEDPLELTGEEEHGLRLKRATCDIGSFQSKWFTPNHSLCALHCVGLGKKGGSCKGTICHCRN